MTERPGKPLPEDEGIEGEILPPGPTPGFGADEPEASTQEAEEAAAAYQNHAEGKDAPPDRRGLQVMAAPDKGGAELYFERVAIAPQESGLKQRTIVRYDEERASRLEAAGLEVLQLPFRRRIDFTTTSAIAQETRSFGPGLVSSYMSRPDATPASCAE